jgi:hypothetical protein
LANGWPDIGVEDPLVGSNHLALAFAFRLAMFTVIVRAVGIYATTNAPSGVLEVVA